MRSSLQSGTRGEHIWHRLCACTDTSERGPFLPAHFPGLSQTLARAPPAHPRWRPSPHDVLAEHNLVPAGRTPSTATNRSPRPDGTLRVAGAHTQGRALIRKRIARSGARAVASSSLQNRRPACCGPRLRCVSAVGGTRIFPVALRRYPNETGSDHGGQAHAPLSSVRWTAGSPIVLREVWQGRLWSAKPVTAVQDGPNLIAQCLAQAPAPAPRWRPRRRSGCAARCLGAV